MAKVFKVTGALAVLRTDKGNERYVRRNALITSSPDTEKSIEHLLSVGLIEESKDAPASDDNHEELPAESWNNDKIDAWAAAQTPPIQFVNPDDADKAPTKKHRLAQITAELEDRKAKQ